MFQEAVDTKFKKQMQTDTRTHTHAHTHSCTRTHARTHARTCTHTHKHKHTQTHTNTHVGLSTGCSKFLQKLLQNVWKVAQMLLKSCSYFKMMLRIYFFTVIKSWVKTEQTYNTSRKQMNQCVSLNSLLHSFPNFARCNVFKIGPLNSTSSIYSNCVTFAL